ncbi:MAG: aminotransferase class III-fold pyridoxal phosphate-dependent enzyme [Shimia sp.]|nr:aminotransferase class III-fold pyridoxal phosphate-dependent enzyme [Shimia sp.]
MIFLFPVAQLKELQTRYDVIADVRGSGLFFGVELWRDGKPATEICSAMIDEMRNRGVLLHSEGRHDNTLKIRPPCVFSRANADRLAETLDAALEALK